MSFKKLQQQTNSHINQSVIVDFRKTVFSTAINVRKDENEKIINQKYSTEFKYYQVIDLIILVVTLAYQLNNLADE